MPRKKKHEDHINHEAWAIPYGDLVTLLLAFFVVMYSISSVNEGKYRTASASLHAAFRGMPRTLAPVQVGTNPNSSVAASINMGQQIDRASTIEMPKTAAFVSDTLHGSDGVSNREDEGGFGIYEDANELSLMEEELRSVLADLIDDEIIQVTSSEEWIEVQIKSDTLFASGAAELTQEAKQSMQKFIAVMGRFSNAIRIEGHTDNVPINTMKYSSNWDLSAARALSVVHMMMNEGIASQRLRVVAFGDTRPIASNAQLVGRQKNRRVNIVIMAMRS